MFLNEDVANIELNEESLAILEQEHTMALKELETITENVKFRVKKEIKLKRMVAKAANLIAKQAGDQLYSKMLFHYLKMKTFRAAIQKKYGQKAKQQVRVYLTRKHSPLGHK
jgi:hypothetical protein